MGMPLREALRRLCVEIGWSYAVFWKAIGFNQRIHLVWEDSCYDQKQFSGTLPLESVLKEQGVVHVIGEGIIGQAALDGTHLWINRDALLNDGIKAFTELNHQFSAGIRTVVVLPVLPHGVLQLGSTCTVMENIPFLILMKSLFSQLHCRPVVSLPDSTPTTYTHLNSPANNMGSPINCPLIARSNSFECSIPNVPKEETLQYGSDLFDMFGASKLNEPSSNFGNIGQNCTENMQTFDLMEEQPSQSGIFSDSGTDQLLDAVVSNINMHVKESSISTGTSTGNVSGDTTLTNAQPSSSHSTQKSQLRLWIEGGGSSTSDGLQTGTAGTAGTSTDMGLRSTNKKRYRSGENPRPRPKDRQLIQDRIKELRELVPNGAKCSIDALLEKTIKHMVFLQSVTKHANKLKESGRPKEQQLVSEEGGVLLKDDSEGGATWAFEVGAQSMSCPIIVEDLDLPRQLLIEMVCEDRGLFLEIADFIKGLGLTILKGVMESRKNKIWARFAVEATRDVTRMEIFVSLVHLLDPTANNSDNGAHAGAIGHNINVLNQTGAIIPTTAVPDSLR
ncbi:Transcription factor-related family protein [Rhynchospora pubera]|uniref:Transcription factor-related family protein n=1 Tax=Rhynchospora pubera TaxID=906938 RepID=A0AAV8DFD8_9POAL|nr:Transcription factor-related family protein [Rhynchospora pubera]